MHQYTTKEVVQPVKLASLMTRQDRYLGDAPNTGGTEHR